MAQRGFVQKRPSRKANGKPLYRFAIDLDDRPAQRCTACKSRVWLENARKLADDCDRCGAPLGDVHKERVRKWVGGFTTKDAATKALKAALRTYEDGDDPFPEKMTFAEFVERAWLPHLEARVANGQLRANTVASYERMLDAYVIPIIGEVDLSRVRAEHVQKVLDAMSSAGMAPRSVARVRAVASSALGYAVLLNRCASNPVRSTRTPTLPKPSLRTPSGAELAAIIAKANGTKWEIAVLLSATTGARRGEVLALRWENVDLDAGRFNVVESLSRVDGKLVVTAPTTKDSVRTVSLMPEVVTRLRQHKAAQQRRLLERGVRATAVDLVCDRGDGHHFDPDAYTHAVARVAGAAGTPGVRLHDLRHGAATFWLKEQGERPEVVSRMLGHSSVAFTLSTYVHPDADDLDALATRAGEAMFGTAG